MPAKNYAVYVFMKPVKLFHQAVFFETFVVLDDHHFMVLLGHQTCGSDRALILNLEGEIVQEVNLSESGPLLAYSDGVLYMQDSDLMYVKAFEFKRVD